MTADVNVTEKVARAEAERRYASPAHYGRAEIQAFIAGALWHRARGADFGPAPVVPDGGHVLTEYGTTSCPVEIVRAKVVDGKCSACGAVVPENPDFGCGYPGCEMDVPHLRSWHTGTPHGGGSTWPPVVPDSTGLRGRAL